MFKKFTTRIRNPKVLTSVFSGILMILVNTGIINAHMSNTILGGFNTVLTLLIGLGIFADPNSHVKQVISVKPEPVVVSQPVSASQPIEQDVTPVPTEQQNK